MHRIAVLGLFLAAGATAAALAASARAATPGCDAANAQIRTIKAEIDKANAQKPNVTNAKDRVQKARDHQIEVRKKQLEAALARWQAAQQKACGPSLADYDGTYTGVFPGTQLSFTFIVRSGVISGDLAGRIADAATGTAAGVRSTYAGADCGAVTLRFDAKAGTATSTDTVQCTLAGQTHQGTLTAKRQ